MTSRFEQGRKVSWYTLIGNVILAIIKAVVGVAAGSAALIADAVHSASDVLATSVVLYGLRVAKRPPDEKHPYGHGRAEAVAAKVVSLLLILVGIEMIVGAGKTIVSGRISTPGSVALWTAALSIVVKEAMYQWTILVGRRINSPAVIAEAWHHRSDAFSSVASFTGILLARSGYPILDPIVAGVVALFVIKVGWDIFNSAVDEMMDSQITDAGILDSIAEAVKTLTEISDVHNLRVHRYGAELHVDLTVLTPLNLSLVEGHQLAHKVETSIVSAVPNATHIDVHVEPLLQGVEGVNEI